MSRSCLLLFFPLCLLTACSPELEVEIPEHIREIDNLHILSAEPTAIPTIQLTNKVQYGNSEDVLIGQIELENGWEPNRVRDRIAVDEKGRVYIGDMQQKKVHVFEADGTWLTSLGREGRGPGEFQMVSQIKILSDQLYIADYGLRRINAFSLDPFSYSHSIPLAYENQGGIEELQGMYPDYHLLRSDETVLVGFVVPPIMVEDSQDPDSVLFYPMNREGEMQNEPVLRQKGIIFSSGDLNGLEFIHTFEFSPVALRVLSNDDHLYTSWTEDFLIKMFSPDGTYLQAYYYPFDKRKIDRSSLIDNTPLDHIKNLLRNAELPDTWPAIKTIMVDDEKRIWVSVYGNDSEMNDWWVISESGDIQGRLAISKDKWIREIRNGTIYVYENDFETGSFGVAKYELMF